MALHQCCLSPEELHRYLVLSEALRLDPLPDRGEGRGGEGRRGEGRRGEGRGGEERGGERDGESST